MARVLAIDYGQKRTGIAVTDNLQITANGLTTVPTHELLDFLKRYVEKEDVERFVVGLPKRMNGEESDNMRRIRPFVRKLEQAIPQIPVTYVDERFTSVLAQRAIREAGLKKKARQNKELVDEVSAAIILQSYLDEQKMQSGEGLPPMPDFMK